MDLACGLEKNLDCYIVMAATFDIGMVIITLGCLYFL
jgi:hypothetical protein